VRRVKINLALQGGGAHGAFTWGVLDRLLEEEEIEIAAISGTSAGALSGAALKAGFDRGGREAARENLDWFWGEISRADDYSPVNWATYFWTEGMKRALHAFTPFAALDNLSRLFSPYDYGPFYANPLRRLVGSMHFHLICSPKPPAFFVSATNVRTGKIRVFSRDEITPDVLMASACLPNMFRAIEIPDPATGKAEAYWDGGYSGNPALFPLFEPGLPNDIVIVNINPLLREDLPETATEILNRINEVSFNSSLLRELRAINFVRRLIADSKVPAGTMKDVYVHMISDDKLMTGLSVETKVLPTPGLIEDLKTAGRAAAGRFLKDHGDKLNRQGSVDLAATYS
jgi:NTE family protein